MISSLGFIYSQRLYLLHKDQQKKEAQKLAKFEAETDKLAAMQAAAEAAHANHDLQQEEARQTVDYDNDNSRRSFFKEFRKVVESADVILEVLDARDPIGCRCVEVEKYIRTIGAEKRVVLLLNKIDLVPKEVAQAWLAYLRADLPTVPFKCSTQQQSDKLGQRSLKSISDADLNVSSALGAEGLVALLKNYTRSDRIKTSITVGVIGLPNVGKSSLINSLKRTRVANVGNAPGVTKVVQEITLDKNIKLLDCPGIVFTNAGQSAAAAALRNCVKIERLEDPVLPCQEILNRVPEKQLMELYRIPTFRSVDQFLVHIAKSRGRLKSGGVPDLVAAARMVLQDWNGGKIPYYTLPPERTNTNRDKESAELVAAAGPSFDLNELSAVDVQVMSDLPSAEDGSWAHVDGMGEVHVDEDELNGEDEGWGSDMEEDDGEGDDDEEEEEEEDADGLAAIIQQSKNNKKAAIEAKTAAGQQAVLYGEVGQHNPHKARAEKKKRKKKKQADEDFDFDEDFEE